MLDVSDRKYCPLHESRKHNDKGRRIAKMMSKQNWFKRNPEDSPGTPSKMMRQYHMDGNCSRKPEDSPGTPSKMMRQYHMDGNC